jgi:ATP-dependent RNA helicase RhlE
MFQSRFSAGNPRFRSAQSGRRGGGGRGGQRQRTFDPSDVIKRQTAANQVVTNEVVFSPKNTFTDFNLHPHLLRNIVQRGYTQPTQIQDAAIPELLDGKDVIGLANTGTGKTAAFLIPLINKVANDKAQKVLIVAPTRELAVQIDQEFQQFSRLMGMFSAVCIGGVNIYPQFQKLRRQPQFVIGTPGRLRDLEEQRALNFADFQNIVLDEVDQMLDMGFVHEMRYIISRLSTPRQSLFFSATLPSNAQQIAGQLLRNPVKISVKSRETAANIDQEVMRTQGRAKIEILEELLKQDSYQKVLVFLRTKHGAEKVAESLYNRGVNVAAVHGNKSQNQRQRALDAFKRSQVQVLLATDVAARGLDIDDVTHVINFDLPASYEDYIHRIGRTGRANKRGIALTFVD